MVVGGGAYVDGRYKWTNDVELVDLAGSGMTCPKPADFLTFVEHTSLQSRFIVFATKSCKGFVSGTSKSNQNYIQIL